MSRRTAEKIPQKLAYAQLNALYKRDLMQQPKFAGRCMTRDTAVPPARQEYEQQRAVASQLAHHLAVSLSRHPMHVSAIKDEDRAILRRCFW